MAELLIVFIGAGMVFGVCAWIEQHEKQLLALVGLPRRWVMAIRARVVSYRERRIDRAWQGNSERGIR